MDSCPGFRFAGVAAGIKTKGGLDVGLIACDRAASAAAVFTGNRVQAAPIAVSKRALRATGGKLRGVVVNSGNANACTGADGLADARAMAAAAAAVITDCDPDDMLVASTGVIGQRLPIDRVVGGIAAAGSALAGDGFADFAAAIMTTDRRPKSATHSVGGATLLGTTKGAGMIGPNMATTLTFVVTDAAIAPAVLQRAVAAAVEPTFNAISVDGDTSTNDTLAVLASGAVKVGIAAFTDALTDVLRDLSRQLIGDGEGVHHVVTIDVRGAADDRAARAVARRIAESPLVKTAIAGGDPNWGRIVCAIGNAGVPLRPDRIAIAIAGVAVVAGGAALPAWDEAAAAAAMRAPEYAITVDLGQGRGAARHLACDLSHDYVTINADYRT